MFFTSCGGYRKVLKGSDIKLKYATAVELYEKDDFHRAMQLFDELLIYYRGTDTSEKINYYYANCYYGEGDFLEAGYYFAKYATTFPASKYAEEAKFMSAFCQYKYSPKYSLDQSITYESIKELQLFIDMYPESKRVAECNALIDELRRKLEQKTYEIARLYFKIENYESAVVSFKNLLKDYPDTQYKEEAYYYILLAGYSYAYNSIESKKNERFQAAKDAYNALMTTYPETKYSKDAKSILKNIEKEITKQESMKTNSNNKNNKQKS